MTLYQDDIEKIRAIVQEEIAAAAIGTDSKKEIKDLDLKYGRMIQTGLEKVAEDSEVALDTAVRGLEAKIKKVVDDISKSATKTAKTGGK